MSTQPDFFDGGGVDFNLAGGESIDQAGAVARQAASADARRAAAAAQTTIFDAPGTHKNPIRYAEITRNDPDRAAKREAQFEQFARDAKAGKVLCLSDLMKNAGM